MTYRGSRRHEAKNRYLTHARRSPPCLCLCRRVCGCACVGGCVDVDVCVGVLRCWCVRSHAKSRATASRSRQNPRLRAPPRGFVLAMDRLTAVGKHRAALGRRANDNIMKRAAVWLCRQDFYQFMVPRKPARFIIMLQTCFGPDQLLDGTSLGVAAPSGGAIILMDQDKSRKRPLVQLKINQIFAKKPRQ